MKNQSWVRVGKRSLSIESKSIIPVPQHGIKLIKKIVRNTYILMATTIKTTGH